LTAQLDAASPLSKFRKMEAHNKISPKELVLHPQGSLKAPARVLYVESSKSGCSQADNPSGFAEYWCVICHRWPWIAATIGFGALTAVLFSFWQSPVYQARVSLEIQNPSPGALNVNIGDLENGGTTLSPEAYLPTQAQILQSLSLRRRTLAKLQQQHLEESAQTADRFARWRGWLGIASKPSVRPNSIPSARDVRVQVHDNTRIVEILTDSADPRTAAAYANTLANEYIDSNLEARSDGIDRAHEFLTHQLEDIRAKLQRSEDQLQAYGRASNLMFTGDKNSVEQEKLKQTQAALSEAQAVRIEKQSAYQMAAATTADSVPQVIDNTRLSDYQSQLAALRRQLAELSSQFTPEHPKVRQVQAQIDDLEVTFNKERSNILLRIKNEYQGALTREKLLSEAYRRQAQVVLEQAQKTTSYNILEREAETNRQLYDSLLQKAKEAEIASAMGGSNARIIDPAEPPLIPYKPNVLWNTLMGALTGLLVGAALVLGRESLDSTLKAPGEVSFHLGIPELGVIPAEKSIPTKVRGTPRISSETLVMLPHVRNDQSTLKLGSIELATWNDKSSTIAESFRSALTSILFSGENGVSPRVILISSGSRGEGKTTVATNLGIALAEIHQRVLLIDADMRQPRLNDVFNVPNNWGLSDLLREKNVLRDSPLEALVQRAEIPNLYVLTSGPRTNNITNLLHSSRMFELIQRLRADFDSILIDTPPMLNVSDARILGRLVDAAILVFRAGKTNRNIALAAKRRLTDDGIPVIGTILNGWDLKSSNRYGYGASYSPYESS
jgi:succinoglycan biosynthesis transport protein ExoP